MAPAPKPTKAEQAAIEKRRRELLQEKQTFDSRKVEQFTKNRQAEQSRQFYQDFNKRMDAAGPSAPPIQYRNALTPSLAVPGGPDIRAIAPGENDPARAPKMIANTTPRGMDLTKPAAPEVPSPMVGMGAGGPEGPSPPANYASDLLSRLGGDAQPAAPQPASSGQPQDYASDIMARLGDAPQTPANKYVDPTAMEAFALTSAKPGYWPKKDSNAYYVTDDDPNKAKILVHRPVPTKTGDNFNDNFVAVPLSSLKDGKFYVGGVPTSPVMKSREKVSPGSAWAAATVNSATFGQGDKVAGAINATIDQVARRYTAPNPSAPQPDWGQSYEQFQGSARQHMANARQDEPGWSTVGDVTGFIQPGSIAGKVGAKVVAPVTNMLAKAASPVTQTLGKMINFGAQGAAGGAAYGYTVGADNEALMRGEESPGILAPERMQSAQTNALVVGGMSAAMPLLAPVVRPVVNTLSNVGARIVEPILPGTVAANTQRIATDAARRSLERSGIVTIDDFMKRAARYGDKPVMTGELGQSTLNNLVSLTRQPGTTAEKAAAILEGRVAGMPGRLLKDIADETGMNPEDAYASLEDMVKTSRAKAAPQYEAAESAPFAETANLERIVRDSPTLRSLYPKAVNRVQNQAVPQIGQADQMPPIKVYDELKQLVDEEITKRVANGQGIDDLQGIRTELVRELDLISGQAATGLEVPPPGSSLYAAARDAGGEAPRIQAGLKQGERAMQGRGVAPDIEREVAALTGQELTAYQIGVLRNIVGSVERGNLTPKRIRSPDFQKRLASVFGEPAAKGIVQKFGVEAELMQKGSRIDPNIGAVSSQALLGGPSKAGDVMMQIGQSAARGNIKDMVINGAAGLINGLRRMGYSESQLNAIGDILTSSPDDAARLLYPNKTPSPGSIPPTTPPAGKVRTNPPRNALADAAPPPPAPRPTLSAVPDAPRPVSAQNSQHVGVSTTANGSVVRTFKLQNGKHYDVRFLLDDEIDAADVIFQPSGVRGINALDETGGNSLSDATRVIRGVQDEVVADIAANNRAAYMFSGNTPQKDRIYEMLARSGKAPQGYRWAVLDHPEGETLALVRNGSDPPFPEIKTGSERYPGFSSAPRPVSAPKPQPAPQPKSFPTDRRVATTTLPDGREYRVKAEVFKDRDAVVMSPDWPTNAFDDMGDALKTRQENARPRLVGKEAKPYPEARPNWSDQYPEQWGDVQRQVGERFIGMMNSTPGPVHVLALIDGVDLNGLGTMIERALPSGKQLMRSADKGELAVVDKRWLRDNRDQFSRWSNFDVGYNQSKGILPPPPDWSTR